LIAIQVPKDKITFIRTIEGRRFSGGVWEFPDSAANKLIELNLLSGDFKTVEKEIKEFELSPHLRKYQKQLVNTALNFDAYALFADTGTGKTVMGLEIANKFNKTLVVCPLSIIDAAWINDCNKFYPKMKIVSLWHTNKKKRIESLNSEADVYVVNFDGVKIIYNEILKKKFDCIIVDESSKMRTLKSQITQTLLGLKDFIPNRFILSGCPTPNHNSEIFPQLKFINPEILGNNFHGFRAKYFSQDMANPHRWFQTQENKDAFFNKIETQCVFLKKEDCVDLPDKVFQIRRFDLGKTQRKYYDSLLNDIRSHINEWSKFEFTAKLMKLREIISGFIVKKNETIEDFETAKDNELADVFAEIGDKPVIVWCQFIHEIERLAERFSGVGLTSKTKDRNQIIDDFKNNKIKLLFAHPKLLGMGLTFVNCNYNVYYSLSFSYEEFKQSQDRIHRIGQENKCTYIVLQGKDTIDESIYECLTNKKNAVDELYLKLGLVDNVRFDISSKQCYNVS
jgi:SNF2 family DNA or RNA helicase